MGASSTTGEDTWRCKACGKRQRDPDPPCDHCWNTTLVRGEDATDAANETDGETFRPLVAGPGPGASLLERFGWATSRASMLSLAATVVFMGAHRVLPASSPLAEAAVPASLAAAVVAAVFLAATAAAAFARWVNATVY